MRIYRMLPLALICLAGCSGGPSLAGKWNMNAPGMPAGSSLITEFTSNKFTTTLDTEQMGIKLHVETSGDYTYDGKKLKMTTTDIKIDDSKLPEMARKSIKEAVEKEKGKSKEGDLKLEGDKATFSAPEGTLNMTRVK